MATYGVYVEVGPHRPVRRAAKCTTVAEVVAHAYEASRNCWVKVDGEFLTLEEFIEEIAASRRR